MERRKFLIGTGALAAGAAAGLGSGAFSSAEAHREVNVDVVGDESAYLGLTEGEENGEYADVSSQLRLIFNDENEADVDGEGINTDAITLFDDVFRVENNGSQEIEVWVDGFTGNGFFNSQIAFYVEDNGTRSILSTDKNLEGADDWTEDLEIPERNGAVTIPVGQYEEVGVLLDGRGESGSNSTDMILRAEATDD